MRKIEKFFAILIVIILCLGSYSIIPNNIDVKADSGSQSVSHLDTRFVWNITSDLSNIIFQAYNVTELQKGREFGSKGERQAINYSYNTMQDLGLNPVKERIQTYPTNQIDDKLEVLSKNLEINGVEADCYISPQWNNAYCFRDPNNQLIPEFNTNQLDLYLNYSSLHVYQRPSFSSFKEFSVEIGVDLIYEWVNHFAMDKEFSYFKYFFERYQSAYQVYLNNITQEQARETFPWFDDFLDNVQGDYILIDEDPWNNPNAPDDLVPHSYFLNYFSPLSDPLMAYPSYVLFLQMMIMRTNSSCKGLILYDFNDDVHDMNRLINYPLPTIFINKSDGLIIKNNMATATINFSVNQQYNNSVESYNVIGTIPGEDNSKTIIISSLLDSWWNQGTADSSIGMGLMLSTAKWFKDNNIVPKYKLKFIGFGDEEYGYLGAKSYQSRHEDETIVGVIDLNQLGFTQSNHR